MTNALETVVNDAAYATPIGPNDLQQAEGRLFKKESAWWKLARRFGISTRVTQIETRDLENGHIHARCIVRATAPWGQTAEAAGGCSTEEERFQNAHARATARVDCEAIAETRATNRAISRLVPAGEVSAEEVEHDHHARAKPALSRPSVPLAQRPEGTGSPTHGLDGDQVATSLRVCLLEPWEPDIRD